MIVLGILLVAFLTLVVCCVVYYEPFEYDGTALPSQPRASGDQTEINL